MKHRLESAITSTSFQPWPGYAFTHLQQAYTEVFAAMGQTLVGSKYDATKVYLLYGCAVTTVPATMSSPGWTNITAGAVFYNGEVYLSPSQSFQTESAPMVLTASIATAFADPAGQTVYTDGSVHQDCQVLTVSFAYALSGTGTLGDYHGFIPYDLAIKTIIGNRSNAVPAAFNIASTPVVAGGLGVTLFGTHSAIDEGFFLFQNQLVYFPAQTLTPTLPPSGTEAVVTVATVDGLAVGTIAWQTPVTDTTRFLFNDKKTWSYAVGLDAISAQVTALTATPVWTTIGSGGSSFGPNYANAGGSANARFTTLLPGVVYLDGDAVFTGTAELLICTLPVVPSQTIYRTAYAVTRVTSTPSLTGFTINIAINHLGQVLIVDLGLSGLAVSDIHYIHLSSIEPFLTA